MAALLFVIAVLAFRPFDRFSFMASFSAVYLDNKDVHRDRQNFRKDFFKPPPENSGKLKPR
jgi:hypothetical protein